MTSQTALRPVPRGALPGRLGQAGGQHRGPPRRAAHPRRRGHLLDHREVRLKPGETKRETLSERSNIVVRLRCRGAVDDHHGYGRRPRDHPRIRHGRPAFARAHRDQRPRAPGCRHRLRRIEPGVESRRSPIQPDLSIRRAEQSHAHQRQRARPLKRLADFGPLVHLRCDESCRPESGREHRWKPDLHHQAGIEDLRRSRRPAHGSRPVRHRHAAEDRQLEQLVAAARDLVSRSLRFLPRDLRVRRSQSIDLRRAHRRIPESRRWP